MIIGDKKNHLEIVGVDTSKKATISQDKMAKLQYLLTKGLYKDPQTAVIAEWTNNGVDSMVQAGKDPIKNPVVVSLEKSKKDNNQWIFSVEDKGTGLDDWDFRNVCMNYLESTKDGDNETIGAFGIGMKSFLALERHATFRCRKNGKERTYIVYEGVEFVNYDLISEVDTTEENGVRAELIIAGWIEQQSFSKKMKTKLSYYDTVVIMENGKIVDNKIYRNELFQWSESCDNNSMHLCLKDVYYEIDWTSLGIPSINIPIALRFGLGEGINPTPSRESYITTEVTKELIIKKIGKVADWLIDKYNSQHDDEYATFFDAYLHIDNTDHHVNTDYRNFRINAIEKYGSKAIPPIKVKGIVLHTPKFYKDKLSELLYEWGCIGHIRRTGSWTSKMGNAPQIAATLMSLAPPVLLSEVPGGNVKSYLKQTYAGRTLFVKEENKRVLGTAKNIIGRNTYNLTYNDVLGLRGVKKELRRSYIKEWQYVRDSLATRFIDERNITQSQKYITWLENKRKMLKSFRSSSEYVGLNKGKDDVTIAYTKPTKYGISFKKEAFKIGNLKENQYLTVIATINDNLDKFKEIAEMLQHDDTTRFALVGKKEIRKIPNHYQFKTLKQFIMDSKPFKRLASSILFDSVVTDFEKLRANRNELFKTCLSAIEADYQKLKAYIHNNYRTVNNDVSSYILDVAKEKDLFDKELFDVYQRMKENLKKYDFITCLKDPATYDTEAQKKYKRIISQMLLFRKKYYDDLPENVEIEVKIVSPGIETKEGDEEEGELDDAFLDEDTTEEILELEQI